MTYPMAIILAAALLAGAILASSGSNAGASDGGAVALESTDGLTVWVARQGGDVRVCRLDSRGTAQLGVLCSEWN